MSANRPGYVIEALGITNPAGLVLKHKLEELKIPRKNLAEDLGIGQNNFSIWTRQDNRGPSFATDTGRLLVSEIAKAERAYPDLLTEVERKNPKRREKMLVDSMALLSIYSVASRHAEDAHQLFSTFAEMVSYRVYKGALTLLGEAVHGVIDVSSHSKAKLSGAWGCRSSLELKVMRRRAAADTLYAIDSDGDRSVIVDAEVRRLAANGELKAAMDAMVRRHENLETMRTERDEALMADPAEA